MSLADEHTLKHQRLSAHLGSTDLDAVLLSRRCNFSWLTCGAHNYVGHACDVGNSHLLVDERRVRLIANNIEAPRLVEEELAALPVELIEVPYEDPTAFRRTLAGLTAGRRVGCDAPVTGLDLPALDAGLDRLRWQLSEGEIQRYRQLCTDVVAATEHTCRQTEPGWSENQIAGRLCQQLLDRACVPWVLLVGGDLRLRQYRHPLPTDNVVRSGFMVAVCAERNGLIAACSRLVSFGSTSAELATTHEACATVDAALWSRTQPGTPLGDIFAEAVEAYEATGFRDEWRLHHQGGSIGYLPRETKATPGDRTTALDHQAFAWNPSITGTKCEDTILCAPTGAEALAEPTDWPRISARWKGFEVQRPDILIL